MYFGICVFINKNLLVDEAKASSSASSRYKRDSLIKIAAGVNQPGNLDIILTFLKRSVSY